MDQTKIANNKSKISRGEVPSHRRKIEITENENFAYLYDYYQQNIFLLQISIS